VLSTILGALTVISLLVLAFAIVLLRGAKDLQEFHERRTDAPRRR
jgi:hypothetical protein